MRMWPSPVPRQMRFHDVRHTTITMLLRLKVPMQIVQRIAPQSNIRLTVDTYGHLDVSNLREAMETLGEATGVAPRRARGRGHRPHGIACAGSNS